MNYYDMDGHPIDMQQWSELFDSDDRIIARTDLPGGCMISTVWLGMDMSFGEGPPLIFESMVFGPDSNIDLDCVRYPTRAQAEAGHSMLVTRWTGWTPGDSNPDGAEASLLTRLVNALWAAIGERPITPEEAAFTDEMVVMYPKEIAPRMEEYETDQGRQDRVAQNPAEEQEEASESVLEGPGGLPDQDDRGAGPSSG